MDTLTRYGATSRFLAAAELYPGLCLARVVSQYKKLYKIASAQGETLAEVSGKFRHEATRLSDYPAVGDFVMVNQAEPMGGNAVIQNVLPRKSAFA